MKEYRNPSLHSQNWTVNDFPHFFVQSKQLRQLCKDYSEANTYDFMSVLVSGPTSCGKTSLMKSILKDYAFDVFELTPTSYTNISQLKDNLQQFIRFRSVLSFDRRIKKLLFIEDLDNLEKLDRYFFSFYQDLIKNKDDTLNFHANCLIITTTNSKYFKKLTDLLPHYHHRVSLPKLTFKQCFCIINAWLSREDLDDLIDYDKLKDLIQKNNYELRVIFNHIEDTFVDTKNPIDIKKDLLQDAQPSDLAKLVMKESLTLSQIEAIVSTDTNQTLALIHENYPRVNLMERKFDVKEMLKVRDVSRGYLDAEFINKVCFENGDSNLWGLYEYYLLKHLNVLLHDTENLSVRSHNPDDLLYSQLINKQSLAFNFNKKLTKAECQLSVVRKDLTWMFYYLQSVCKYTEPSQLKHIITKNEIEVLTRFASDQCDTSLKHKIQKLKSGLD